VKANFDPDEFLRRARERERTEKAGATEQPWPEPKAMPNGLSEVEAFSAEFLPEAIAPWVNDIAERLQCPVDYVAVAAITALGSVIGRRVGIKPQAKTDWSETPNLWGMFIGRPGMLKSPAMMEALKPLHFLEAEAAKENEIAAQAYAVGIDAYKLRKRVMESLEKKALKNSKGEKSGIGFALGDEPKEPLPVRYRTNDSTYEAVGELLIANPTGILIERDELVSLLKHLDRDEQR
jgi:putative DNA primase/helicase